MIWILFENMKKVNYSQKMEMQSQNKNWIIIIILVFCVKNIGLTQPNNFINCHYTVNDIQGSLLKIKCPYFVHFGQFHIDSITSLIKVPSYDEDGIAFLPLITEEMDVVAEVDTQTRKLNGFVCYLLKGDTIFIGAHKQGRAEGKAVLRLFGDTTIAFFRGGKINGDLIEYDREGNTHFSQYKNGKKHGVEFIRNDKGVIEIIRSFKNDKIFGIEAKYYENGNLNYAILLKRGKIVPGIYYYYTYDGTVRVILKVTKRGKSIAKQFYPGIERSSILDD